MASNPPVKTAKPGGYETGGPGMQGHFDGHFYFRSPRISSQDNAALKDPNRSPRSTARKEAPPTTEDPMIMNCSSCRPEMLPLAFFGKDRMCWGDAQKTRRESQESAIKKLNKILSPAHYDLMYVKTGEKQHLDKLI